MPPRKTSTPSSAEKRKLSGLNLSEEEAKMLDLAMLGGISSTSTTSTSNPVTPTKKRKSSQSTSERALLERRMVETANEITSPLLSSPSSEKRVFKTPTRLNKVKVETPSSSIATSSPSASMSHSKQPSPKSSPRSTPNRTTVNRTPTKSTPTLKSPSTPSSSSSIGTSGSDKFYNEDQTRGTENSDQLIDVAQFVENAAEFQFSDTHVAFLKLRQEIQNSILSCRHLMKFIFPPIILKHLLYNENVISGQTPTQIEQIINQMIDNHEIRKFYIDRSIYKDIFGFVFMEDYVKTMWIQHETYINTLENTLNEEDKSRLPVFQEERKKEIKWLLNVSRIDELKDIVKKFCELVLPIIKEPFIEKRDLIDLLFEENDSKEITHDEAITHLMALGSLTIRDVDSFFFSIPNLSQFMYYLHNGRKEILNILRRKQFKEIMVNSLLQKNIRNTIFNPMFHIRDMIGEGDVTVIDINGQAMLRLK